MRFPILPPPLRLPYRRMSLIPMNLHMDPGWSPRLVTSIILVQHAPRNAHWRVLRHHGGGCGGGSNSCSIHRWLPPPCPRADALLFWEAALPHRQRSECVDPVCRSVGRLIKLHPGLWFPPRCCQVTSPVKERLRCRDYPRTPSTFCVIARRQRVAIQLQRYLTVCVRNALV